MSTHFHILLEVPEKDASALSAHVDDAELVSRVRTLNGRSYASNLQLELRSARANGLHPLAESIRSRYLDRMCDLSAFVKGLKQRFTQWFNSRNGRKGTLWEDRFKSVLVEDTQNALLTMGTYIDLNPVRAGICDDPKDYRDCGYSEAIAGKRVAREGISRMLQAFDSAPAGSQRERGGEPAFPKPTWHVAGKAYRALLFGSGGKEVSAGGETVRKGIPTTKVEEAIRKGHRLTPAEILRCRVRYFCDGLVFGTADFVEGVFQKTRERFGSRRTTTPPQNARSRLGRSPHHARPPKKCLRLRLIRTITPSAPGDFLENRMTVVEGRPHWGKIVTVVNSPDPTAHQHHAQRGR